MSSDRVALITGAAGGIGAATARTLVRDGLAVVLHDLRLSGRLEQLAARGALIATHIVVSVGP